MHANLRLENSSGHNDSPNRIEIKLCQTSPVARNWILLQNGVSVDEAAEKRQMNGGYRVPLTYQSAWNLVLFKVKSYLINPVYYSCSL